MMNGEFSETGFPHNFSYGIVRLAKWQILVQMSIQLCFFFLIVW
jgi:hypothetical protein